VSRHFKLPKPELAEIEGVKWREHYGCYIVKLAGVLELSFTYTNGGYDVRVNGNDVGTAPNTKEAAKMAIAEACRINEALTKRLSQLEVKP